MTVSAPAARAPGGAASLDPATGARRDHRPVAARLRTLAAAVESAHRPRRPLDVRRTLLLVGATAMGLGLVAIVLGWYGAAHSAYQFQEIPYLISGGLLGVALVAGGGFLFFGSWMVRLIEEQRRHTARLVRALDRLDSVLTATDVQNRFDGAPPASAPASRSAQADLGAERALRGSGGMTR